MLKRCLVGAAFSGLADRLFKGWKMLRGQWCVLVFTFLVVIRMTCGTLLWLILNCTGYI